MRTIIIFLLLIFSCSVLSEELEIIREKSDDIFHTSASINDRQAGDNFLIDTGASVSTISKKTADRLGISTKNCVKKITNTVSNSNEKMCVVTIQKVQIGTFVLVDMR